MKSVPAQSIGGMEVLVELSRGGMGSVLLARRSGAHGFERLVAVKTIRSDLAERDNFRQMFLDEGRLLSRLDHPNIAHVYDFGEEDGLLWLAMEYVPGLPLDAISTRRDVAFPVGVAARVVAQVCRGLHAAHELAGADGVPLGVVHRDVSPPNVLVGFDGRIKIIDFGIALMKDRLTPVTEVGVLKGKLRYMAPEQLSGARVDRRVDVYAAAMILFELLTGKKLFAVPSRGLEDFFAEKTRPVPLPSEFVEGLPRRIDDIVRRGLAVQPDGRFETAKAMALALEEVASEVRGESVEAYCERAMGVEREKHMEIMQKLRAPSLVPVPKRGPTVVDYPADLALSEAELLDATKSVQGQDPLPSPPTDVTPSLSRERETRAVVPVIEPSSKIRPVLLGAILVPLLALGAWVIGSTWRKADEPVLLVGQPSAVVAVDEPAAASDPVQPKTKDRSAPAVTPNIAGEQAEPPATTPKTAMQVNLQPAPSKEHAAIANEKGRTKRPRTPAASPERRPEGRTEDRTQIPVADPGVGFLTVGSDPYALVLLDGREMGASPILSAKVSAGHHELKLLDPVTRTVRLVRTIEIAKDAQVRVTWP